MPPKSDRHRLANMNTDAQRPTARKSPWPWLATVVVLGGGAWFLWRSAERPHRQREVCKLRLKQIGQALHQYHERYHSFPPAYVLGPDEKPWHSWRVLLLPFLSEDALHREYRFDEPWNGEHNRRLSQRVPECYRCPSDSRASMANFLAVVDRRTMWPAHFTVRISDVIDGTSNTVMLVEALDRDINWLEPRDLTLPQSLEQIRRDEAHGVHHVLFVDGAVRAVNPTINEGIWRSLLTPQYGKSVVSMENWPPEQVADDTDSADGDRPAVEAESLPKTQIIATTDSRLDADSNTLWCATMQMAWDRLRDVLKTETKGDVTDIPVRGNPPLAVALNARRFPLAALVANAYELRAEVLTPSDGAKLLQTIETQFFKHNPDQTELPNSGGGIRIKASLHKNLPFETRFDRLPEPIRFQSGESTTPVAAFGPTSKSPPELFEQIIVRDYVSDDDFVVELITATQQRDCIILANVSPSATLEATWQAVNQRRRGRTKQLQGIDVMAIPVLRFHLTTQFNELIGRRLEWNGFGFTLVEARQSIRFRLDERGADLLSVAELVAVSDFGGEGSYEPPPKPRHFVFDKPFLIALRESKADEPYFVAWIASPALMETEDGR